ncbi:hypothetical protein DIURU_003800 [Diutina rugosa]|uniref:HRDC domain-containing protein n=1 Tax=Diutina rugosa TaxID=5481 RepID=A0A642UJM8_DIURU|nr:uncharacterized protein DIURU_003800 [Diutina rugosa]KAA8900377.1 hypothetical protein DIURU_003800 [Diutina rugosa]
MSDFSSALPSVVKVVRSAVALGAQDPSFYRSIDKSVGTELDVTTSRLTDIATQLGQNISGDIQDVIGDDWKVTSDVLDQLFERLDRSFDEIRGKRVVEDNDVQAQMNIPKPQLKFTDPLDNLEQEPFKPRLTSKPNSLVPLELELITDNPEDPPHYAQPYAYEIDHQTYPETVVSPNQLPVIEPQDWNETEAIWVDDEETLLKMADELANSAEIAVDLEHHDTRTYFGITCLMQISNRDHDWLIDTLALRSQLGKVLNPIFTDPTIVKVFHGAFMDIIWLQRDLGLYVVSLFDTFHASKRLGLTRNSLAYLLEHYAKFSTSKKYQLADWRVRPLPAPMVNYARADTHFLLYIYDQMRNKLAEIDGIAGVLHESRQVAKRRFEYPKYMPRSEQGSKGVSSGTNTSNFITDPVEWLLIQFNLPRYRLPVVRALYEWRDAKARADDESPRHIMPNQSLVALAMLEAPVKSSDVLNSTRFVSEAVRINARQLAELLNDVSAQLAKYDEELAGQYNDGKPSLSIPELVKASANVFNDFELPTSNDLLVDAPADLGSAVPPELIERLKFIRSKLEVKKSTPVPAVVVESVKLKQETLASTTPEPTSSKEEEETKETSTEPTESKEEVIALRNVRRQIHTKKRADTGEVIDFANNKSVLGAEDVPDNNTKKRRRFKPGSNVDAGPQAPKKRRQEAKGRSGVFRN